MKKHKRVLSLICIITILFSTFGFSGAAYSNPAAATPKDVVWYTVTDVLSVERGEDVFVVNTALQPQLSDEEDTSGDMDLDFSQIQPKRLTFYISFPVEGGFRLRLSTDELQSGFFNPSALSDITYSTATDTKTVMRGADDTVLIFEKTADGFVMSVGDTKENTALSFTSADMEFGYYEGTVAKFRMTTPLRDGEAIYNGSERFNAVNQVGQTFSLRNEDCWSDDPVSYINVPIFHSSEGYSIWYNMTYTATADVGATDSSVSVVEFEGGKVDFYIWSGTILENIKKYTAITGTSIVPPKWAFGYWLGAQAIPWRTDANGVAQADGSDAAKEVCYQNLVDMFEGYEEMGITDIPAIYGEGMNSTMMAESYEYVNSRGSRMLMWYHPRPSAAQMATLLPGYAKADYPYPLNINNPVAGNIVTPFIDFSHPNAKAAITSAFNGGTGYSHNLKYWDLGLKGAMIDYGEWLAENTVCYNGRNGDEMHNLVSYYYAKAQKEAWDEYYPDGDYILFERSGCAGSQAFVANFTGDQKGNWEGLGDQVSGILSMSTGGFNIVGGDMGGFGAGCSEELYMRWVQLSAFSPLMRLHGQELRTPWGKGDEAYAMFPTYYWFRQNMRDTLYSASIDANKNATPMVQPLGVAYQGQDGVYDVEDQYLFCSNMLVSPVITEGATTRTLLLPNGNWYNLWTHERQAGGQTITVSAPKDTIPVYLKSGATMAVDLPASLQIAETMEGLTTYESLLITPPDEMTVSPIYDTVDDVTNYTSRYVNANMFTLKADKGSNRQAIVLYGVDASDITVDGSTLTALSKMPDVTTTTYGFYTANEDVTYLWLPSGWQELSVQHVDSVLPFKSSANGLLGFNTTVANKYPNGLAYANYSSSSAALQEECLSYLNAHYNYYYTDYSSGTRTYRKVPFVGNANGYAWNLNAIFSNTFLQISGGMTSLSGTAMRQIAALVPKASSGDALMLKNFKADFGIRFEKTYGSVVLAFRQSTVAGFFTSSGESTAQTYLKISPSAVELYDRGTKTVLHTYSGTIPGSAEAAKNFTVSISVVNDELKYTIRNDGGAVTTVSGTATITDSGKGYMALAMVGAYNGLRLMNVYQADKKSDGTPSVQASQTIKNGSLEITALQSTPNADGYYPFKVVATPNSGYQLRAGSLLAIDVNGDMQIPINADYREFGTGDTFIVYAKQGAEIYAEFYQPETFAPNISLIGTSYNEENCGLRFVYRLYREIQNDKPCILLNGKWVEVADYGMLVAVDYLVGNQQLTVDLSEKNSYIKKVSIPAQNKYYDISDQFVDISVQVVGMNRLPDGRNLDLVANAYVQLADGTYLYANSYTDNFVDAGGPAA